MNNKNKFINLFVSFITSLFLIIMFVLTGMALFWHCKVDINSYHLARRVEEHRPMLYILMGMSALVLLVFCCKGIMILLSRCKDERRGVYITLAIGSACMLVACAFWILFNDSVPKNDQIILFEDARILAGVAEGIPDTYYFGLYPRNKGLLLFMTLAIKIFGDTQLAFRIFNVIAALALFLFVCLTVEKAWKHAGITILTAILLVVYYPIVVYTAFLYGTLFSAALAAGGIYGTVRFCEDKDIGGILLFAICFPMAILMHQSALIACIASLFYIMIHFSKKYFMKMIIMLGMTLCIYLGSGQIIDYIYEAEAGIVPVDAVPALAWVYMGITSENADGGPGAQDGSFIQLFMENDSDAKLTNREALNRIKTVVSEYVRGERDWNFFVEKIKYQWLDPTFGARKTIVTNDTSIGEPANSPRYLTFFHSGIRDVIFRLFIVYMVVVYSLNLLVGCKQFGKGETHKLHFLIQILLLGGFTFQLIWESLSRYCFPYFVWLIPEAAYGVYYMYTYISLHLKSRKKSNV